MTIRIITQPSLYLVGFPDIDGSALDRFLDAHDVGGWDTDVDCSSAEKLVEVAGRLCYMSFAKPRPGGNAGYIGHILEVAHGSVLEHATFNIIMTGVSRSFTHELVRHRAGFAFSQLSQRYVDESDVAFVVPPALLGMIEETLAYMEKTSQSAAQAIESSRGWDAVLLTGASWLDSCEQNLMNYRQVEDFLSTLYESTVPDKTARRKAAREAARSVLPNATETKIFVSANARAWRNFIEQRSDPGADAEIRRVAVKALALLKEVSPNLFGDYVVDEDSNTATTPYRKV